MEAPASVYLEDTTNIPEDVLNLHYWLDDLSNGLISQEQAKMELEPPMYTILNELLPLSKDQRINYALEKDNVSLLFVVLGLSPYKPAIIARKAALFLAENCLDHMLFRLNLSNETDVAYLVDSVMNVLPMYDNSTSFKVKQIVSLIANKISGGTQDTTLSYREQTTLFNAFDKIKNAAMKTPNVAAIFV